MNNYHLDPTVRCDTCKLVYSSPTGSKCAFNGCAGTLHAFVLIVEDEPRVKSRCDHAWTNYRGMDEPIQWCKRCGALDIGAAEPILPESQMEDM
jgi:hypothetical protein